MSRQFTQEEVQEKFLNHLWDLVKYWETVESTPIPTDPNPKPKTTRDRLEGLAFSILAMLDGCAVTMPAFEIYPAPHPEDKQYCKDNKEDWWPQLEDEVTVHGNEMLHDLWSPFGKKHGYLK